ncbi:hypothetical protein BD410DRAFT_808074 [Rickenella mellea]|uniref:Uncharacterized protein n=1 Tax=Rickenella mellea TaxID=50990 RepID=A0A4Y7PMY7_9AGAM|nr:hypothetical protein BD410DRAFT_808074 [Rickenella mellea]
MQKYQLLLCPFGIFVIFVLATVVAWKRDAGLKTMSGNPIPNRASNTPFHCILFEAGRSFSVFRAVNSFSIVLAFVTLVFEGLTTVEIHRHRTIMNEYASTSSGTTAMFIRGVVFSVYRVTILGFSVFAVLEPTRNFRVVSGSGIKYNGFIDLIQAALPLVAGITFGSQQDYLDVWCFWKRERTPRVLDPGSVELVLRRLDSP